ncbi:hypothetical protein ACIBAG_27840 [Streptomyces sp. NPDC051243]
MASDFVEAMGGEGGPDVLWWLWPLAPTWATTTAIGACADVVALGIVE